MTASIADADWSLAPTGGPRLHYAGGPLSAAKRYRGVISELAVAVGGFCSVQRAACH
jgi:hypothetical protein